MLERVTRGFAALGFAARGMLPSPIEGAGGNKEFLVHFERVEGLEEPGPQSRMEAPMEAAGPPLEPL